MNAPTLLFSDNTVPINFSLISEMELLRTLLGGQGAWTGSVQAECENSVNTGLYPGLEDALGFIALCLHADDAERRSARTIRRDIAKPGEPRSKSFGEAETIAVILNRGLPGAFLTDDGGAARYVDDHDLHITVVTTAELLALAVLQGLRPKDTARQHVLTLMAAGPGVFLGDFEAALM